jgi:hypothetical protein
MHYVSVSKDAGNLQIQYNLKVFFYSDHKTFSHNVHDQSDKKLSTKGKMFGLFEDRSGQVPQTTEPAHVIIRCPYI